MKAIAVPTTPNRRVTCPACLTHARPLGVPWQQHVIGCPVRVAALGGPRQGHTAAEMRMGIA
jgi:hypothetical protein